MIPLQPPSYFISGHQGMVSRDMWFSSRYQPPKIKNVFFKKKKIVVRNQSHPSLLHSFYTETGALSERMKLFITYSRRIQPSKSNLNNEALYWLFLKQVACVHRRQMEDKTIDNLSRWSQRDLTAGGVRCPLQPQLQRGLCRHLHGTDTSLPGLRLKLTFGAPAPLSGEYTSSFPIRLCGGSVLSGLNSVV